MVKSSIFLDKNKREIYNKNKGNTAQFTAHALLEYCSVMLPKKVSARRQPYLDFLSNLTKNLTSQSAHLNYAVLPKKSRK